MHACLVTVATNTGCTVHESYGRPRVKGMISELQIRGVIEVNFRDFF